MGNSVLAPMFEEMVKDYAPDVFNRKGERLAANESEDIISFLEKRRDLNSYEKTFIQLAVDVAFLKGARNQIGKARFI